MKARKRVRQGEEQPRSEPGVRVERDESRVLLRVTGEEGLSIARRIAGHISTLRGKRAAIRERRRGYGREISVSFPNRREARAAHAWATAYYSEL